MAKIKIALIYRTNNPYLCGLRSNNNYEKFYLHALKNNEDATVDYYGDKNFFDCKTIAGKYDVYLFYDAHENGLPQQVVNIELIKGLKICRIGDAHGIANQSKVYGGNKLDFLKKYGIDYCYYQHTEQYFYKFYPKDIKYWWIPVGIDPELYKSVLPWNQRRGDKLLLSGSICEPYYHVRMICKKSKNVFYQKPGTYEGRKYYVPGKFDKDKFKELLEQWKVSLASACSVVLKYFETPAAGCLSLAEVDENNGASIIGFKDYETALLVNENNVLEKIDEVLKTIDDPKWEQIANNGRQFVFNNYTHDLCVARLINKIKEVL